MSLRFPIRSPLRSSMQFPLDLVGEGGSGLPPTAILVEDESDAIRAEDDTPLETEG